MGLRLGLIDSVLFTSTHVIIRLGLRLILGLGVRVRVSFTTGAVWSVILATTELLVIKIFGIIST